MATSLQSDGTDPGLAGLTRVAQVTRASRVARRIQGAQPVLALLGLVGLALAGHWAVRLGWPLPFCALRKFTGLPCPACGSTRSLLAWTEGDPGGALFFNPLCFAACLAVALWAFAWCLQRVTGRPFLTRSEATVRGWLTWKVMAVAAVANWLYLCLNLPK